MNTSIFWTCHFWVQRPLIAPSLAVIASAALASSGINALASLFFRSLWNIAPPIAVLMQRHLHRQGTNHRRAPDAAQETKMKPTAIVGGSNLHCAPRSGRRSEMANIPCVPCRAQAKAASARPRPPISSQRTSTMPGNSTPLIGGDGNVIRFRPHGTPPRRELDLKSRDLMGDSAVKDLRKYEYAPEGDDDFRHRMLVNLLVAIVVIVLIVTGSWMVDTITSSWPR
jgi:hypothetical protein